MSADAAILVYAARYALGRMSGAASDVESAIAANLGAFVRDAGCREALIRDIEEAEAEDRLGMPVDRSCWMRTLGRLQAARDGDPRARVAGASSPGAAAVTDRSAER